jgi:outer membrane protein assembly factor BamE
MVQPASRSPVAFGPPLAPATPAARRPRLGLLAVALLAGSALLSGCVYRMSVQQGNFLDARQVVQLKEGMTRAQVRFLLGTPMLPDAFERDRWDYLYTLEPGRGQQPLRQRLTVYFTEDKVSRIDNDGAPTEIPADQQPPAAAAPAAIPAPAAEPPAASSTPAPTPTP